MHHLFPSSNSKEGPLHIMRKTVALKKPIHTAQCTIHKDHKATEFESCGKSFFEAESLKKHIHSIHNGHKNYKCEYCGKSLSAVGTKEL